MKMQRRWKEFGRIGKTCRLWMLGQFRQQGIIIGAISSARTLAASPCFIGTCAFRQFRQLNQRGEKKGAGRGQARLPFCCPIVAEFVARIIVASPYLTMS
jgi:hypothetical protein